MAFQLKIRSPLSLIQPRCSFDHDRVFSRVWNTQLSLRYFFALWLAVLYLAAQCRNSAHYSPCTFLFLPALPTPFHLWGVGHRHPSALSECMASMWCLHLPPWTSYQFKLCQHEAGCCINTASAHSMVRLSGSGLICMFPAEDVDVEMHKCSPDQVVDEFPLLLVVRLNDAWHISRVGN